MSTITISNDLLALYKKSIGDFNGTDLDNYYKTFLTMAISDLLTDDIDQCLLLNSDLGQSLIVLYAEQLMNKEDIATNPTISLLRNKLSIITKGQRV